MSLTTQKIHKKLYKHQQNVSDDGGTTTTATATEEKNENSTTLPKCQQQRCVLNCIESNMFMYV